MQIYPSVCIGWGRTLLLESWTTNIIGPRSFVIKHMVLEVLRKRRTCWLHRVDWTFRGCESVSGTQIITQSTYISSIMTNERWVLNVMPTCWGVVCNNQQGQQWWDRENVCASSKQTLFERNAWTTTYGLLRVEDDKNGSRVGSIGKVADTHSSRVKAD